MGRLVLPPHATDCDLRQGRDLASTGSADLVLGDRDVDLRLLWGAPTLEEGFRALRSQQQHQTRNRRRMLQPPLSDFLRIARGCNVSRSAGVSAGFRQVCTG